MEVLAAGQARALCRRAILGAGAGEDAATTLADATLAAEIDGLPSVGFAHLVDYLTGFECGRIDGQAMPSITHPAPALILSDASGGIAQLGFDRAFAPLVEAARGLGVAIFSQRNSYTCGELGWFVKRLAAEGLVGLAATNGPQLMAPRGVSRPVYCTNPMAFAAPAGDTPALVIDQSSSEAAFVRIREAAAAGRAIPEHWAIGPDGNPTTDPAAAMKGALVAFAGARGANIALMVEVLAAGLSGANWSLDAPSFSTGHSTPGTGLFVLAIAPALFGEGFERRVADQLARLQTFGVHIPGRAASSRRSVAQSGLEIDPGVLYVLRAYAGRSPT